MKVQEFIYHHDDVSLYRAAPETFPMVNVIEFLQDNGFDCRRRKGIVTNNIFYVYMENTKRYTVSFQHHWNSKYTVRIRSESLGRVMFKQVLDTSGLKNINEIILTVLKNYAEDDI
jgi:hypothetical protein